jgi:small subunit ribosomal protein S5
MKRSINPSEIEFKEEKVVKINRVAKVVKGGRRFSFNAIVVVGDGNGHVGVGMGKANEVMNSVSKGKENAKKSVVRIPIVNGTLPHAIIGRYGAGRVMLKPASPGTGIIAGGAIRAIMEEVGITDVLAKILGSRNPHNVIKATMDGLEHLEDATEIARRRGISIQELFN